MYKNVFNKIKDNINSKRLVSFFITIGNDFVFVDSPICSSVTIQNEAQVHMNLTSQMTDPIFFFFCNRHCNPCGVWPTQLSLSILSRKFFTECRCQRHVKPPTWRTSD